MLIRADAQYRQRTQQTEWPRSSSNPMEVIPHLSDLSMLMPAVINGWSQKRANATARNSTFDDELIGWRKIPSAPRKTMLQWVFDDGERRWYG